MKFTEEQEKVIKSHTGNNLVNASSGSGKSSVVVANIGDLISNHDVDPSSILVLSFSNTAANSIKDKLKEKIGASADNVNAMTLHSFAYKKLKSEYPLEFNDKDIVKQWFQLQTVTDIVNKPSRYNEDGLGLSILPGQLLQFISYQKANMVNYKDPIIKNRDTYYVEDVSESDLQKAYDKYCSVMINSRNIDFDDMLLEFYNKLIESEELRQSVIDEYQYILVDEAQDTSHINMEILKLISNDNILFVGDFRQGIYSFNNSSIDNILNFANQFDNVNVHELSYNFRSTKNIVKISNDIISKSPDERYKMFKEQQAARHEVGEAVSFTLFNSERIEAEDVVDKVLQLIDSGVEMNEVAILNRTNNGLLAYESLLSDNNIPVRLSGGGSFYDRNEIVDIMSYLRLSYSEDDNALRRIYNRPNRYLSNKLLYDLDDFAAKNNITLETAMRTMDIEPRAKGNVRRLLNDIDDIRAKSHLKPNRIIQHIIRITNYEHFLESKSTTSNDFYLKSDAINRLTTDAERFREPHQFLTYIAAVKRNSKIDYSEAVNLMTVHASKGLEYEHVFVTGVNDQNFPHPMDGPNLEESRRLLYVAVSRAKDYLYISIPVNIEEKTDIDGKLAGKNEESGISPFIIDVGIDKIEEARRSVLRGNRSETIEY